MIQPVYCLLCKAAHVREDSPLGHGWAYSVREPGWVCPRCLAPERFEHETEPNAKPLENGGN
jgi:hypothetical protein